MRILFFRARDSALEFNYKCRVRIGPIKHTVIRREEIAAGMRCRSLPGRHVYHCDRPGPGGTAAPSNGNNASLVLTKPFIFAPPTSFPELDDLGVETLPADRTQTATFGSGCFWCRGRISTRAGRTRGDGRL